VEEIATSSPPADSVPFGRAFDAVERLKDAWIGMRAARLALWLGGLLMLFFDCNGSRAYSPPEEPGPSESSAPALTPQPLHLTWDQDPSATPALDPFAGLEAMSLGLTIGLLLVVLAVMVVFFLVRCFLRTGWIRLHDHVLRTGTQAFKPLFSGADRLSAMILHRLLAGTFELVALLPLVGGAVLLVVGTTDRSVLTAVAGALVSILGVLVFAYVWLGTSLGPWAVVLDGLGPVAALKRGWSLVRGNRLSLFLYFFLNAMFSLAAAMVGIVACCVGLVATLPGAQAMVDLSRTQAYLLATRGSSVRDYWRLFAPVGMTVTAGPPGGEAPAP
jgi:hypothetical protein